MFIKDGKIFIPLRLIIFGLLVWWGWSWYENSQLELERTKEKCKIFCNMREPVRVGRYDDDTGVCTCGTGLTQTYHIHDIEDYGFHEQMSDYTDG